MENTARPLGLKRYHCVHSNRIFEKELHNKSRVSDHNEVSQVCYIVEIHHTGREPSKLGCTSLAFNYC